MPADFDYVVIGSGFGGSVAALRLAQKGYRVAVLERGQRWNAEQLPQHNWQLSRYLWMPRLGLKGIQELTLMQGLLALTGSGVGGGSLVYGGVLERPSPEFFKQGQFGKLCDWGAELRSPYVIAERMLGAAQVRPGDGLDEQLSKLVRRVGGEHRRPRLGVFATDEPGKTYADPYFEGDGPQRTSCNYCGGCMTGCRYDAKNTLDKNYLYLAQQLGAKLMPGHEVGSIMPLGSGNGADGYRLAIRRPGFVAREQSPLTARGVVVAAGTLGTNRLLLRCRDIERTLPALSPTLGSQVTNNREELMFLRAPERLLNPERMAVHSLAQLDPQTQLLLAGFSPGSSLMALLAAPFPDTDDRQPGLLRSVLRTLLHPIRSLSMISPRKWASSSRTLVMMQSGSQPQGTLSMSPSLLGPRLSLRAEYPDSVPAARAVVRQLASHVQGTLQPLATNAFLRVPATAHIFGGCPIGADIQSGTVDVQQRAFGYENLYVLDGSVLPPNMGSAPSLTITAMAERAMSFIERVP